VYHRHDIGKRRFSVKVLSWCAPKASPGESSRPTRNIKKNEPIKDTQQQIPDPIDAFGVVAAMSKNRVIGLKGQIPWPRSTKDRTLFKELTQDTIMILGRTTYEEEPEQKHISHASHCIVVSSALTEKQLLASNQGAPNTVLKVAKSFPEALGLANTILNNTDKGNKNDDSKLKCWICGGERIYEEALKHKSVQQVHLTIMDIDIDLVAAKQDNPQVAFAMFPAKHRWDRRFQEISRFQGGPTDHDPTSPEFTHVIYERKELVPNACGEEGCF